MRRLARLVLLSLTLLIVGAAPAQACGYWDCTEYDGVTVCYWYED